MPDPKDSPVSKLSTFTQNQNRENNNVSQNRTSADVIFLGKQPNVNTDTESRISTRTGQSIVASSTATTPANNTNQLTEILKTIQSTRKSVEEFINKSSTTLRNSRVVSKSAIKGFFLNFENEVNIILRNQLMKIVKSKYNVHSNLKIDRQDPQRRAKLLHLTTYLKSLSRLKSISDEIATEMVQYYRFLKKFSYKIIMEDPQSFGHFQESVGYLRNSISALAMERMSNGIAKQLSCLEQLRISFANGHDVQSHKSTKKVEQNIRDMMAYQTRVLSSTTSIFVTQLANLTKKFHTSILNEAKKNEALNNSQSEAFSQILDDIEALCSVFLVNALNSDIDLFCDSQNQEVKNGISGTNSKIALAVEKLNTENNEAPIQNLISSLNPDDLEKCHKSILKLIDLWEKKLLSLLNKHLTSHQKESIDNLKNRNSGSFSTFQFTLFDTNKLDTFRDNCISNIKAEQKKISTKLRSRIKSTSHILQKPIDLVQFIVEDKLKPNKVPMRLQKCLSKIQVENERAIKLISKWSSEFVEYYENTSKDFKDLIGQNQKHFNLKQLRDQKYQAIQIIVQNFSEEVNTSIESSEEMTSKLSLRLNLSPESFNESNEKIKACMSQFRKHMNDLLAQFETFVNNCSKFVDDFFHLKSGIIKTTLTQLHLPLKEFLICRGISLDNNGIITPIKNAAERESTTLPRSSKMVPIINKSTKFLTNKSPRGIKGSAELEENDTEDLPKFELEPNKRTDLRFVENYIHASMQETNVPKWAEIDETDQPDLN